MAFTILAVILILSLLWRYFKACHSKCLLRTSCPNPGDKFKWRMNTFLPARVHMRLTSGIVPNQLPAAIIGTGVLIVPNAVSFLGRDKAQKINMTLPTLTWGDLACGILSFFGWRESLWYLEDINNLTQKPSSRPQTLALPTTACPCFLYCRRSLTSQSSSSY